MATVAAVVPAAAAEVRRKSRRVNRSIDECVWLDEVITGFLFVLNIPH